MNVIAEFQVSEFGVSDNLLYHIAMVMTIPVESLQLNLRKMVERFYSCIQMY